MQMALEPELLKSLSSKPITLVYPFEKPELPEGLRGKLKWDPERCVGCGICVRDCPAFALELVGEKEQAELIWHAERCIFCAQCAESCPRNAIELTQEFELSTTDSSKLTIHFSRAKK